MIVLFSCNSYISPYVYNALAFSFIYCCCVGLLQSDKIDFFHELENIISAQRTVVQYANANPNIPILHLEKISRTFARPRSMCIDNSPQLSLAKEVNDNENGVVHEKGENEDEKEEKYSIALPLLSGCLSHRRYRNLFDLVLECEFQFEHYGGDWIEDEYFLILDNAYLVS